MQQNQLVEDCTYYFTVEHVPGKENQLAYVQSRSRHEHNRNRQVHVNTLQIVNMEVLVDELCCEIMGTQDSCAVAKKKKAQCET
ncbi:hypothetical protein PR048_029602 [Dryococelus australis]|uniref:Uncharacterized protein n=1 Tax=Dryococelus australis TaxID=614101 RepID=A0ABQ9GDV2_9NEOP|nr:hypothetical protein PR048_029602 [Dryococelus australis]